MTMVWTALVLVATLGLVVLVVAERGNTEELGRRTVDQESTIQVQLTHDYQGFVTVFYNGEPGSVCDDDFDNDDAQVICREVGLSGGEVISAEGFENRLKYFPIWIDGLLCEGSEASIADCRHNGFGITDCSHAEDVAIRCRQGPGTGPGTGEPGGPSIELPEGHPESDIRIELTHGKEGFVVVYVDDRPGSVCDDNFDDKDATVVCRHLGLSGGKVVPSDKYQNLLKDFSIWMDEVQCEGSEAILDQCRHTGFGITDCSHAEDVAIQCKDRPEEPEEPEDSSEEEPTQAPTEDQTEAGETSAEEPGETSAEEPGETSAEEPGETSAEEPGETSAEELTQSPIEEK